MPNPHIDVTNVQHIRVSSVWWVVETHVPDSPEDITRIPTHVSIHRIGGAPPNNEIVIEQTELDSLRQTILKFELAMGLTVEPL